MSLPSFIINQFAEYNQHVNQHNLRDATATTVPVDSVTFPVNAFGQHHLSGDSKYLKNWFQTRYKAANKGVENAMNQNLAGNGYIIQILALLAVQNGMTQETLEKFLSAYDYGELPVDDFIEPFFIEIREFMKTWHLGYYNISGQGELTISDNPFSVLNITILGTTIEAIYIPISPRNFLLAARTQKAIDLFEGYLLIDDLNTISHQSAHDYVYSTTNIEQLKTSFSPHYEYESHKHIGLSTDAFETFNKIKNKKFPHLDIPEL